MVKRRDVAKLAGVSEVTVSRVFNETVAVSFEKQILVREAANQLGYSPNQVASSLRRNSTKQLLLLLSKIDYENPYYIELFKGVIKHAESAGYLVSSCTIASVSVILKKIYDGIIIPNGYIKPEELKKSIQVPTVVYGGGEEQAYPWIENITIDTGLALELMIGHLREAGHTRIGFALSHNEYLAKVSLVERYKRYINIMRGVFGESINSYIFGIDETSIKNATDDNFDHFSFGKRAAEQIYEKKPDITAVVCFNDEVALGLIWRLQSLGVRVPDDLSVGGIDGIRQGAYCTPPLTTVKLPAFQLGEECAKRLINKIKGNVTNYSINTTLDMEVLSRGSVKFIK